MRYKLFAIVFFIVIGVFALGTQTALAAEFKLDSRFQDADGDMVADTPSDRSKQIDPGTLIFAYTPVEDPAVYAKVWKGFLEHMEKVTGKKVQFFAVQSNAAQIEAMRAGRLHVAGFNRWKPDRRCLRRFGLTVGKDVNEVYLGGPVSQLGALEKGIVDATTLSAPTTLEARGMGLKELINIGALKLSFVHAAIGVNRAFAKNNPEMIDAFLKAYIDGIKMMREEPEVAQRAIAKYTGINEPDALKVTYETFLPAFQQRVPYVLRDSVRGVLNFSTSPEAKSHRPEDFIDHSFLERIEASSFVEKLYGEAKR